ncbi:MAG: hypothetical protein ACR2QM_18725 [Longimicrobiales bacterium]
MLHRMEKLGPAALVAGLLVVVFGVQEAQGQRGRRGGDSQGRAAMRGAAPTGVERAIRLADELELSDDQRAQLEGLRVELVEIQSERAARRVALGSQLRAGLLEPEALRGEMEEFQSAAQEAAEATRASVESLLTEEQMDELTEMTRPRREGRGFGRNRGGRDGRDMGRRSGPRRRGPAV